MLLARVASKEPSGRPLFDKVRLPFNYCLDGMFGTSILLILVWDTGFNCDFGVFKPICHFMSFEFPPLPPASKHHLLMDFPC